MNEPLFKNSFVRDKNVLKAIYKNHYFKSPLFILFCVAYSMSIFSMTVTMRPFYSWSEISIYYVIWLFLGILFFSLLLFRYRQSVKISAMRDRELSNGRDFLVELNVFDDRIELIHFENKQTLHYADVKYASNLKEYINIITKAKYVYTFKKDSFTLGTSDEFIDFLKEKGIIVQK